MADRAVVESLTYFILAMASIGLIFQVRNLVRSIQSWQWAKREDVGVAALLIAKKHLFISGFLMLAGGAAFGVGIYSTLLRLGVFRSNAFFTYQFLIWLTFLVILPTALSIIDDIFRERILKETQKIENEIK